MKIIIYIQDEINKTYTESERLCEWNTYSFHLKIIYINEK